MHDPMNTGPLADFVVCIDDKKASPQLIDDIRQIVVETSLHAPGMFEITVFCPQDQERFRWVDDAAAAAAFKIGAQVCIAARAVPIEGMEDAGLALVTLLKGEIATLETHFTEAGAAMLVARGYDNTHKLHCGRKTATYLNMTDSEIVAKVVRAAGLDVDVDSTTAVHEYVLQYNQTDMEFLQARARRVGFELLIDEQDTVHFKPVTPKNPRPSDKIELEWGQRLRQFQARVGAGKQASAVAVRGWDSNTRQLIEAIYEPSGDPVSGGALLRRDLSDARARAGKPANTATLDQPVALMSEAEALAESIGQDVLSEFVEASGTCLGMPAVKAGARIHITGIGDRMSGAYLVTAATHTYRQDEEYLTEFTISSRVSDSFSALILDGQAPSGRVAGMAIGVVTNVNDNRKLGRVKVKFPWMGDAPAIESAWCRIASPMAGPGRGWMCLPEINDEVLVAFEHGDVSAPYIVGGLWNNRDQPPRSTSEAVKDSKVNVRVWRSRSGHELLFDDTPGKERVLLCDKTGANRIEIDSSEDKLTLAVAGDCLIQSKGDLTLDSGTGGDMTLNCKAFKLVAQGNCDLSSPKFDFNNGALEIT